jgi:hypothetical protein
MQLKASVEAFRPHKHGSTVFLFLVPDEGLMCSGSKMFSCRKEKHVAFCLTGMLAADKLLYIF